jgi:hypothetical protein
LKTTENSLRGARHRRCRAAVGAFLATALAGCAVGGSSGDAAARPDTRTGVDGGPVALGAVLVQRYSCPTCHTSSNPADGVLSGQTVPQPGTRAYPRNLTPDPATGLGDWTDEQIVRAMREGVSAQGAPLCVMPLFSQLTDTEALAIVAYLRTLAPVVRTIPDSVCSSADAGTDASDVARPDVVATDTGALTDAADAARPDVVTPPPDASGGCAPVLTVNEVQVAGAAGAGDECVEVYNAAGCTASLTGYTLEYASAAGTTVSTRWTGAAGDTIAAHGYFVVAGAPFTGTAQGRFAGPSGILAATGGGIGIYDPGGTRLDGVGYGAGTSNPLVEAMPAMAPPTSQSIARSPDGADSDNNSADYHLLATPTPGAANP